LSAYAAPDIQQRPPLTQGGHQQRRALSVTIFLIEWSRELQQL
jgi:hypothetical protein